MPTYNVLSWQNENALTNYPLDVPLEVQDFIVDAKFIQFDGFIPVLNYIFVEADRIRLAITFDYGQNTAIDFLKEEYLLGESHRNLRIYTPGGDRYLGVLVFGLGAYELWRGYTGRKLTYDAPFLPDTVRSIPFKDAVYLFDGNYGDVTISKSAGDTAVFFNTNTNAEFNAITFNAVGGHSVDSISSSNTALRKINLVKPVKNNITLAPNDVIKVTSVNTAALSIDLVAGASSSSFALPTLSF